MPRRKTQEETIAQFKAVHGDKYDYSKVEYKRCDSKIRIICPKHGEFLQTPNAHSMGQGCPKCTGHIRLTTPIFVERAMKAHGNKYDYSKVDCKGADENVCIICPEHGEFWQRPADHVRGHGCPSCAKEITPKKRKRKHNDIIKACKSTHGDKYDYSKAKIINVNTKMEIICPKHGSFWQRPHAHIRGAGCPECSYDLSRERHYDTIESWMQKARLVHGDKFDYSNVIYKDSYTKVCIICPTHGPFWQKPSRHLQGDGCPVCGESHGEKAIRVWLERNSINYVGQYRVELPLALFSRNHLRIDFYLPDYNAFIEFHGKQHYMLCGVFHKTESDFAKQQDRDRRLREYCQQNKIRLIEIPYTKIDDIEKILTNKILNQEKN